MQMLLVVVVAKLLGAIEYGYFVATLATVSLFSPLAGLGLHAVIVRDGSLNPASISTLTRQALVIWWKSALIMSLFATVLAWLMLGGERSNLFSVLFFALGEIMTSSGVELVARARQAQRNMRSFGALQAGLIFSRLFAIGFLSFTEEPKTHDWFLLYGAFSLGYLAIILSYARFYLKGQTSPDKKMLRAGIPFWAGALSLRLQTEFNKPVLAQLSLSDTGSFNIAQKVIDMATLPILAMQETLLPRLLSAGDNRKLFELAWFYLTVFALFMSLLILLIAPLIPSILGSEFEKAVVLVSALAWLPLFQVQRSIANAKVIANGQSDKLTSVYILNALFAILIILAAVQLWGTLGVVYAAYLSESILTLALLKTFFHRKPACHD